MMLSLVSTASRRRGLASAVAIAVAVGLVSGVSATAAPGEEPYRPYLRFTPEENWINDPNGLVYHEGQYHLFYQHNPRGNTWGNMSWGHATSSDLLRWREQPVAIVGDENEDIFSGSAVSDTTNSSGFGTAENPPLVAIYTSAYKPGSPRAGTQAQSLAYSTDDGQTWTRYAGNPVVDRGSANFRDPKVFRYDGPAGSYWVMVAVEALDHRVVMYRSDNLIDWEHLSDFGPANAVSGIWECPDLFPIAVDGDPNNVKWVMIVNLNPGGPNGGSAGQYFVGDFDGTTFTAESIVDDGAVPPGELIAGFNSGSYEGWVVANEPGNWKNGPWTDAPAAGTLPGQNPVSGFVGAGLVNGFTDGDWPVGTITSPEFTVGDAYLNFLVGGGNHPHLEGTGDGAPPAGELLFDGFEVAEGTTLADLGWESTGDLIATSQPARSGGDYYIGVGRLNTFETGTVPGDENQGTLTSPEFTISRDNLSMLVGGGFRTEGTGQTLEIQLLVGGEPVRALAGDEKGALNWKGWDVSEFLGQQARIRVVDEATGGWGHLTADHVILSDEPAVPRSEETAVNLLVDGEVVRTATGGNSENLDWTSWDLRDLAGRTARIQIVDHNRFGWGHVLADEFILSDVAARPRLAGYDWIDWGRDNYATVTFNNVPDGRRYGIGWMNNWDYANQIPTSPWRGAMTLPRELGLTTVDGEPKLVQHVVDAIETLEKPFAAYSAPARDVTPGVHALPAEASGSVLRIDAEFSAGDAERFGFVVRGGAGEGTPIGYDVDRGELSVDRTRSGDVSFHPSFASVEQAPVALEDGRLRLTVFVDRSSVEVFAQGGLTAITDQIFPSESSTAISLYAEGGTARLESLEVTPLYGAMYDPQPVLGLPGAPTAVTVVSDKAGVTVSWQAPTDTGHTVVTGYTVRAQKVHKGKAVGDPFVSCQVPGSAMSCIAGGLAKGESYRFTVTASNIVGNGPSSLPSAEVKVKSK